MALYCGSQLEDICYLFRQCLCTKEVWYKLSDVCPNPITSSTHLLELD